jgi:hypothetical protein
MRLSPLEWLCFRAGVEARARSSDFGVAAISKAAPNTLWRAIAFCRTRAREPSLNASALASLTQTDTRMCSATHLSGTQRRRHPCGPIRRSVMMPPNTDSRITDFHPVNDRADHLGRA